MTYQEIGNELRNEVSIYVNTLKQKNEKDKTSFGAGIKNFGNKLLDTASLAEFINSKIKEILIKNNIEYTEKENREFRNYIFPVITEILGRYTGLE